MTDLHFFDISKTGTYLVRVDGFAQGVVVRVDGVWRVLGREAKPGVEEVGVGVVSFGGDRARLYSDRPMVVEPLFVLREEVRVELRFEARAGFR